MFWKGSGNLLLFPYSWVLRGKFIVHMQVVIYVDVFVEVTGEQFWGPSVFVNIQITNMPFSHIVLRVPSLMESNEQFLMSRIIQLRNYRDRSGHLKISYVVTLKAYQNLWCGVWESLFLKSSPGSGDDKPAVGPCLSLPENCYSWRTSQNTSLWLVMITVRDPWVWFRCKAVLGPNIERLNYSSFFGPSSRQFVFCPICCVQEISGYGGRAVD